MCSHDVAHASDGALISCRCRGLRAAELCRGKYCPTKLQGVVAGPRVGSRCLGELPEP